MANRKSDQRIKIYPPWSRQSSTSCFYWFFFANNWDFSSQIGFVVCLANSINKANIIHWLSIKCKQVIQSVLATELYGMAHEFNVGAVIKATLRKILGYNVFLVFCTDSKSLYNCFVKLGKKNDLWLMSWASDNYIKDKKWRKLNGSRDATTQPIQWQNSKL